MQMTKSLLLVNLILFLSGCGTVIFKSNFDQNAEGALPTNQPPGSPAGDRVLVKNGFDIQVQDNNIDVIGNWVAPLQSIGGTGKSLTFWPYSQSTGTNGVVTLVSAVVSSNTSKKTAFWNGKKEINENYFGCTFQGRSGTGENSMSYPIVAVVFQGLTLFVEDGAAKQIGSVTPRELFQDAPEHNVFISYKPQSNSYRVNIQQVDKAEITVTGTAISTAAQTAPRFALECNQGGFAPSFVPTYMMDNVIMREIK